MLRIDGDECHEFLMKKNSPKLAFDAKKDFGKWRKELRKKLAELTGYEKIAENACPLSLTVEEDVKTDGYRRVRFVFQSEYGSNVPCYLLIPDTGKEKYPLAILLQGHTSGFHLSVGLPKPTDGRFIGGEFPERNFFGVQAVREGYCALCIEQRALGERMTRRYDPSYRMCDFVALGAILMGRTVIGERAWDVSRAIDAVEANFGMVDTSNIVLAGHSGGGTATFYTACLDDRIKVCAVAGAFCTYDLSILSVYHCPCNYIPSAYEYFDMGDLTGLIAPRRLIVCSGDTDTIFPRKGVETAYKTAERVFEKAGVPDNCRLVRMPCGHEWRASMIWKAINEETEKAAKENK